MANIRLNSLTSVPRVTGKNYIYSDLHLDVGERKPTNKQLNQNPERNDFKCDYDLDALKNSIRNIFTTNPGEKILNPEFGINLMQFVFAPISDDMAKEIKSTIKIGIGVHEPRIKIVDVVVIPFEDDNEYDITVEFDVPTLNIRNQRLFGSLNQSGYIYKN